MSFTYNNIVDLFRNIAEAHNQINDFGAGMESEIEGRTNIFPLLWVRPLDAQSKGAEISYRFRVFVADLLHKDRSNEQEVSSDTERILGDIIAIIKRASFDFDLDGEVRMTWFVSRFGDDVCGWYAELNVLVPADFDICAVPAEAFTFPGSGNVSSNGGSSFGASGYSGFSGYSGETGQQGEQGTQGETGEQGKEGSQGQQGEAGSDGASGFSGRSGFSGANGINGSNGASGVSGFSGASGRSGFSGVNGTIGSSGASGFSGVSGVSGTSGRSGFSGVSGYSGTSGRSGFSGYSGVDANVRPYKWNTSTSGDPTLTKMLMNTSDFSTTSSINISFVDNFGGNQYTWFGTLAYPNNPIKGTLFIQGVNGFVVYSVADITFNAGSPGWYTLSVYYNNSTGVSNFSNNEVVKVSFTINGSNGVDGTSGVDANNADISYHKIGYPLLTHDNIWHTQAIGMPIQDTATRYGGEMLFIPWILSRAITIESVALEIMVEGSAGSKAKIGLYDSSNEVIPVD